MKVMATYLDKRKMEELGRANSYQTQSINPDSRVWNEGWTPERVAMEIGHGINAHHVRGFYRTIGLQFATARAEVSNLAHMALEMRIIGLETAMAAMQEELNHMKAPRSLSTKLPKPAKV